MIFADRLHDAVKTIGAPACVGLDPRLDQLPQAVVDEAFEKHGATPEGAAAAILAFNRRVIEVCRGVVPAVKLQIAFYEAFGPEGLRAYRETLVAAQRAGLVTIGDVKRGDIGSTSEAYADAHLGFTSIGHPASKVKPETYSAFPADAVTVSPYLGSDTVSPFLAYCNARAKGLFVVVKTTNASSIEVQDLRAGKQAVYEHVAQLVRGWGEFLIGESGYCSVGAVVGATFPEAARQLRALLPAAYFLVPGYGAQGATPEGVRACFDARGGGALVAAARSVTYAWQRSPYAEGFGEARWDEAVAAAAADFAGDVARLARR